MQIWSPSRGRLFDRPGIMGYNSPGFFIMLANSQLIFSLYSLSSV